MNDGDSCLLLRGEVSRLKRIIGKISERISYYRELNSYLRGEVEHWRELAQERNDESL